jgi:hypothetical protein
VSPVVQTFPSSHAAVLLVWTQPEAGLHESSVQTLPSLQLVGEPLTHEPFEHVSPVVQAFPSSHDAVLLVWPHPVVGSHESSVQGFPSSQAAAKPWTQPVVGSHESSVHWLPSSQSGAAPPTQAPLEQVSPVVQAFPSSHEPVWFV